MTFLQRKNTRKNSNPTKRIAQPASKAILDEPSEGLAPVIVREIISILIVEQNIRAAFAVADRRYILSKGCVCFTGATQELRNNEAMLHQHLGV